jgi:predicted lipoprotein with Yx(FWY)xxD motif
MAPVSRATAGLRRRTATPNTGRTATPNTPRTATPNTGRTATPNTGRTATPNTGRTAILNTGRTATLGMVLMVGLGTLMAGCVGGRVTTLTSPPTTDAALTLTIQLTPAGAILATGTGYTLYAFGPDTPTRSTCVNAGCLYQWPPLLRKGTVLVGPGVDRSLVGTLTRAGGSPQLSYDGHPLYTYIRDGKPGVVMGQDVDQDGGPWYVLNPQGDEIRTNFTVNP